MAQFITLFLTCIDGAAPAGIKVRQRANRVNASLAFTRLRKLGFRTMQMRLTLELYIVALGTKAFSHGPNH